MYFLFFFFFKLMFFGCRLQMWKTFLVVETINYPLHSESIVAIFIINSPIWLKLAPIDKIKF